MDILGKYENQNITLRLPDPLTVTDIEWLSVWCFQATVNFGDVQFEPSAVSNVPDYTCLDEVHRPL